jgi:NADPH2:quinone reductase
MQRVEAAVLDSISDYRLIEEERPLPASGEVLIKVGACGVGYVDALVALGRYQVKPPLPHTPGQEVGGWVEALGEGVSGLHLATGSWRPSGAASPNTSWRQPLRSPESRTG